MHVESRGRVFFAMSIHNAAGIAVTAILLASACGQGLDSRPTPVPVYPPGGDPATGSSCGLFGGGGVQSLALARERPVAVVGYGSGRVAAHSVDDGSMIGTPTDHRVPVTVVAVSGDASSMASASTAGDIIVAPPGGGRPSRTLKHGLGWVKGLAYSPDGSILVSANGSTVRAWRVDDGAPLWSRPVEGGTDALYFSADGQTLIAGTGVLLFRRASDGAVIRELPLRERPVVTGVAADGSSFVGVVPVPAMPGAMAKVGIWRASDGEPVWTRTVGPRSATVYPAGLSPDGSTVAVAGGSGTIQLFRAEDGSETGSLPAPHTSALAFAPGAGDLVIGDEEGGVRVLALPGGEARAAVPGGGGHGSPVFQVGFSPDGTLFASSSYSEGQPGDGHDRSLKLWRVSDGRLLFTVPGAAGQTSQSFAFSPDSGLIATAHDDQRVHLVRTSDGQEVAAFADGVHKVAFAPDGQTLLTACRCGGDRRPLRRWRVADGVEELGLGPRFQIPAAFAFSPDGATVAVVDKNSLHMELALWQTSDGNRLWQASRSDARGLFGDNASVVFSPDGTLIAYSTFLHDEADVRVHQSRDGKLVRSLQPKSAVQAPVVRGGAISFSRDGVWLAAGADGDQGGGLTLYRTATWGAQPPLPGRYLGVAFSPTEDRLLGGGRDRVMRMFCGITGMLR